MVLRSAGDISLKWRPIMCYKVAMKMPPRLLGDGNSETVTSDQFQIFEVVLKKRRRKWLWRVSTTDGYALIEGSEGSRPAAKYKANRALFLLLLSAPYRSIPTLLVLFGITAARQNLAELLFNCQA
jgi:hypothetical protein